MRLWATLHRIQRRSNGLGRGLLSGHRILAGILGLEGGDVLGQKVVQHGADGGDHRQLPDVLPGGGDGGAQDVGGEREFQRQQDPGGEFQPDLASAELGGLAGEDGAQDPPKRLRAADDDDDDGADLDDEGDIARDDVEVLLEWNGASPLADARESKPIRPLSHPQGGDRA
jgi:hypothetical protein